MLNVDVSLGMDRSNVDASALHYAAGAGAFYDTIMKLHESDPKAILTHSTNGGTPLHWAAGGNDVTLDTISALIKAGAKVDTENNQGLTPLIMAAASEKDHIAAYLVQQGACRTFVYPGDTTVFHISADLNLVQTLTSLLSSDDGRNWVLECLDMRNHKSQTPLDLAVIANHVQCVQLLLPPGNVTKDKAIDYIARTYTPKQLLKSSKPSNQANTQTQSPSPLDSKFITDIEINAYQKAKSILSSHPPPKKNKLSNEQKKALTIKTTGNQHFAQKDYEKAIQYYTDAIRTYPGDATFYSNRSASYINLKQYDLALEDAVFCKTLNPHWSKAEYRLAVARLALLRYEDAAMAAWEGLKLAPDSEELTKLLKECVQDGRKAHLLNHDSSN